MGKTKVEFEQLKYWLDDGVDIVGRKIMISEGIDDILASSLIRSLHTMADESTKPIKVYINSPGGEAYSGLALYDALREISDSKGITIITYGIGAVMSVAFVIFMAGDVRECSENCTFMMHEASGGVEGKGSEMKNEAKEVDRLTTICCEIISEKTSKTKNWWKKFVESKDRIIDKKQAIKLGVLSE